MIKNTEITFKKVLEKCKRENSEANNQLHWFSSKFSIYFSYILIKLRLSADQVTILFFFTGLIGSILYLSSSVFFVFLGYVCYRLHIIFDMCDGDVARFNNSKSIRGSYWDAMIHSLLNPLYATLICISYYLDFNNINFLILAPFISLIFSLTLAVKNNYFKSLFYNKIENHPKSINLNKGILKRFMYVMSEIISLEGFVLLVIPIKYFQLETIGFYSILFFMFSNALLILIKFFMFSYKGSVFSKS